MARARLSRYKFGAPLASANESKWCTSAYTSRLPSSRTCQCKNLKGIAVMGLRAAIAIMSKTLLSQIAAVDAKPFEEDVGVNVQK